MCQCCQRRQTQQNPQKYVSLVWTSASKSGHTAVDGAATRRRLCSNFKLTKNKANSYKNKTKHSHIVCPARTKTTKFACMCVRVRKFVLHPVRMCVCDTSCERVWNVNNNNKHLHNHSTLLLSCQILSPKKKPQSSLRCYCLSSSSSSFGATEIVVGVEKLPWASHRPWWQHWRIHPWLGKNVSWQPSHTHTHTRRTYF